MYCALWLGILTSNELYSFGNNAVVTLIGSNNTQHTMSNIDLPFKDFTHDIHTDIPCNLGILQKVVISATTDNSLKIKGLPYVRYEGKDFNNPQNPNQYASYFYDYKTDDSCYGECCISLENEPLCTQVSSKDFNLQINKNCDVDGCEQIVKSVTPEPTTTTMSPSDPLCSNGILGKDNVCCHSSCVNDQGQPQCGGVGCSQVGLGYDFCCSINIKERDSSCDNHGAPCMITSTSTTTTTIVLIII
jgi:hypothetical protein